MTPLKQKQNNIRRKKLVKQISFTSKPNIKIKLKIKKVFKKVIKAHSPNVKSNQKQNTKSIKHQKMKIHKK